IFVFTGGLVACAVFVMFAMHDSAFSRYLPWKSGNVDELIREGKLEDALPIMQDLKRQGKLSKSQQDSLNKICVSLAKQYAQEKRFPEAIALLEQVPAKSNKADEARTLMRKYKAMRPSTSSKSDRDSVAKNN